MEASSEQLKDFAFCWDVSGTPRVCRVRLFRWKESSHLIVVSDVRDDRGLSILNASEENIATLLVKELGIDPATEPMFVIHEPASEKLALSETYRRVTFIWDENSRHYTHPQFPQTNAEEIADMIGEESPQQPRKTALRPSTPWAPITLITGILCLLLGCASCCFTKDGTYGPEEFYNKGGGDIGYGAKYYSAEGTSGQMLFGFIMLVLGGILVSVSAAIAQNNDRRKGILSPKELEELRKKYDLE